MMGEAVNKLIQLAGTKKVSSYKRLSPTGKVVHVNSYWRSADHDDLDDQLADALKHVEPEDGDDARAYAADLLRAVEKKDPKAIAKVAELLMEALDTTDGALVEDGLENMLKRLAKSG